MDPLVTMNRPEYRNARDSRLTWALDDAFTRAIDDEIRPCCPARNAQTMADALVGMDVRSMPGQRG
jgi:enoyl-CoA hydratase/carnithine racemase